MAAAVLLLGLTMAMAHDDAERFVSEVADNALRILSDKTLTQERREQGFRRLLINKIDIKRVGRFALGPYARRVAPEEFRSYIAALEDFLTKVYLRRLGENTGVQLKVSRHQQRGKTTIVSSALIFNDDRKDIPLDWWLVLSADAPKEMRIFDIRVAGVWIAQEQRASFMVLLKKFDGDITKLTQHLRDKAQGL